MYFLLHPDFANVNDHLTSDIFDNPKSTLRSWVNEKSLITRWLPFVKDLQPYKVQKTIPSSTGQLWKDVSAETLAAFGPLDLSKFITPPQNPKEKWSNSHKHHAQLMTPLFNIKRKLSLLSCLYNC